MAVPPALMMTALLAVSVVGSLSKPAAMFENSLRMVADAPGAPVVGAPDAL